MKNIVRYSFCFLILVVALFTQDTTHAGFRSLNVDAGKVIGEIHSFQGLNGLPSPVMAGLPNLIQQYKDLRVNQVRTHDAMGPTEIDSKFVLGNGELAWLIPDEAQRAGVVKAGNASIIFPNESADPEKPESYNFAPSDKVIAAIRASGAEVYYRIGRSWGANVNPPNDFDKFASIVKHIAMHYNQGWANGFHDGIRYWEFWNEPDGLFWLGTPEQFYWLYEKTARALKSVDPALKVGGDGKAFPSDDGGYREGFIDYCAAHHVPLDFYSWHHYMDSSQDPYDMVRIAREVRLLLDSYGLRRTESHTNEWNMSLGDKPQKQNSMASAAFTATALMYMQDAPVDLSCYYAGDAGGMGLFEPDGLLRKKAYTFKATSQMLQTPQRVEATGGDTLGYAVLAGRSRNCKKVQILISNYEMGPVFELAIWPPGVPRVENFTPRGNRIRYTDKGYALTVRNLPWGSGTFTVRRYRITEKENLTLAGELTSKGGSLSMANELAAPGVELIVLEAE